MVPLAVFGAAVVVAVVVSATKTEAAEPAHSDAAPIDLATPVDMANGSAHQSAVVREGDARIEVLSPTLLRLEYSPTDTFEDSPTVNALNRRMPVPKYSAAVTNGWLILKTSRATLRYKVGSGPFTAVNTTLEFQDSTGAVTTHPTWEWECTFDQTCQAGAAVLRGGATLSYSQGGYQSEAGYVGDLRPGASATWIVLGAPAGPAQLSFRYSNAVGTGTTAPRTVEVVINGQVHATLAVPPTRSAQPWSILTATTSFHAGTNSLEVRCSEASNCDVNLDSVAIGPVGPAVSGVTATNALGGWIRGFDTFTYEPLQPCAPGSAGATCQNTFEPLHTDGLLDRSGWHLLDDTHSAVWTAQGWTEPRAPGGDVEDGYLFVYGQDYAGALHTLAQLTGPAPLLPRALFGVWYSDYTPYSSATIENSLVPTFEKDGVPLNTLSLDTDWKAPNNWDGWEWNTELFPHPDSFLRWARSKQIDVTLNVHSSIAVDDPKVSTAERVAGTTLPKSSCQAGICKIWDWSSVAQAESNFSLQQSFLDQGVAFWWLDWCCDASVVSAPGLTPDAWIGHLYAQEMVNEGRRGFVLARIGSSNGNPQRVYPAGPWSDHTSAIAFTGDAWGTWNTLAQEVALTPDEATIGEPYVSDDIGSFLGPPPGQALDPPDLYDRWVQLGTFAPILRLHSNNGDRLPWQYPQPVRATTESFLRLREALIPYTYTLAAQAHDDGLPMARPLYLDYPQSGPAYAHPEEYLFGPDVVVAPVTSPGTVAQTTVWIPPGRWVDYFTGATFTGPTTTTLSVPLSRMPVFVRAGGIIPEQPSTTASTKRDTTPVVLHVFPGSSGSFTLYGDSGTGLGYTKGQFTTTTISDTAGPGGAGATSGTLDVTVGRAHGHYRGEPTAAAYRLEAVDLTEPSTVTLNGRQLDLVQGGTTGPGWSYRPATSTLEVDTPSLPTTRALTVVATGTRVLDRAEPPAPSA